MNRSELDRETQLRVSFAQGWVGLGDPESAAAELAPISGEDAGAEIVLQVQWEIASARQDWATALALGTRLVEQYPDSASAWVQRSFALRRSRDGSIVLAFEALLPALDRFPKESLIPYNLACYQCRLGDLALALDYFREALNRGDSRFLKRMAKSDPDLVELLPAIKDL